MRKRELIRALKIKKDEKLEPNPFWQTSYALAEKLNVSQEDVESRLEEMILFCNPDMTYPRDFESDGQVVVYRGSGFNRYRLANKQDILKEILRVQNLTGNLLEILDSSSYLEMRTIAGKLNISKEEAKQRVNYLVEKKEVEGLFINNVLRYRRRRSRRYTVP